MGSRFITNLLYVTYLCILVWAILLKMDIHHFYDLLQYGGSRSLNLVPLAGTAVYNGVIDYQEIGLNVLIFIPFGMYRTLLRPDRGWFFNLLFMVFVSLLFEGIQYVLAIGATDVTDLIANSLGGLLGIILMHLLLASWKKAAPSRTNLVMLAGTLALLAGLYLTR